MSRIDARSYAEFQMMHLGEYAKNRREYYNNRVSKLYGISPGVDVQTLMTYGPDQWKLLQPSEPKPEEKPKPEPKAPAPGPVAIIPGAPKMPGPAAPIMPGPAVSDEITTIDYPTGSGLGIVTYHVGSSGKAIAALNQNLFHIPGRLTAHDDYYSLKFNQDGDLLFAANGPDYMVDVGPQTGALTFTNIKDDTDTLKQTSYTQTLGLMLLLTQRGEGGVTRLKKYNEVITAKDVEVFASLFEQLPAKYLKFKPKQVQTIDNNRLKYVQDVLIPRHHLGNLSFTPYKDYAANSWTGQPVKVGASLLNPPSIGGTRELVRPTNGGGVNVKLYKNLAELKRRAQMLVGQLRAGNNSKEIFQELKEIENILKKKNGAKK